MILPNTSNLPTQQFIGFTTNIVCKMQDLFSFMLMNFETVVT